MKKQLHILLVSSKYMPEYSGSGYRAHHLYKRLLGQIPELQLTVLCGSTTENISDTYDYEGLKVTRISQKPFPTLAANRLLRTAQLAANFQSESAKTKQFISQLPSKPDLIHIFGECYASATVIDYAHRHHIPLLVEICNEVPSPYQYIPFPHKLWMTTDSPDNYHFVCISESLKTMCMEQGVAESAIWCRPNPVDESRFSPVEQSVKIALRRQFTRFTEQDRVISYIAKLRPSKNHRFLLDVIKALPSEYKLFMKGPLVESGPLAERDKQVYNDLQTAIEQEKLTDRVELHAGFCDNVEAYYQLADAYAFPSLTEGLGTPVLESLACGVPVIANLIPNVTDLWIKNDENGYTSALEPKEFADKLCRAVAFTAARRTEEAAAIVKLAGTKVIDQQYADLIKDLVNKHE